MAPRKYGASDAEKEIQQYVRRAQQGTAGADPEIQTAARGGDPYAQRELENQFADNQREAERQAREGQRAADQQAAEAEKSRAAAQKEAERVAKESRARELREAEAKGVKITTDVTTGDKTIARHDDGAPVYEAGPVGKPEVGSTTRETQYTAPDGRTFGRGDNPLIPDGGGAASVGGTGERETRKQVTQRFRDDRGNEIVEPITPETDPNTGEQYVEVDDQYGRPQREVVGVDPKVEQLAGIEQESQRVAAREAQIKMERANFDPRWQPVKAEFETAKSEWDEKSFRTGWGPISKIELQKNADGHWEAIDADGETHLLGDKYGEGSEIEADRIRKMQAQARQRFIDAKKAYDAEAPKSERLTQAANKATRDRLALTARRTRIEAGLSDDFPDAIIEQVGTGDTFEDDAPTPAQENIQALVDEAAGSRGETSEERQQRLLALLGEAEKDVASRTPTKTPEDGLDGPAPGEGTIDTASFGNVLFGNGDASVELVPIEIDGEPSAYGDMEVRNNTGRVGKLSRTVGGVPYLELEPTAGNSLQFLGSANPNPNLPTYLSHDQSGGKRKSPTEAASWAVETMAAFRDPSLTDTERAKLLSDAGADMPSLVAAARDGAIPVQVADALAKDIYGTSVLLDSDPADPANFEAWAKERGHDLRTKPGMVKALDLLNSVLYSPAGAKALSLDKKGLENKELGELWTEYLTDWSQKNFGKPGFNLGSVSRLYEAVAPGSATGLSATMEGTGDFATKVWESAIVSTAGMAYGFAEHVAGGAVTDLVDADWITRAGEEHDISWSSSVLGREGGRAFKRNIQNLTDRSRSKPGAALQQELQSVRAELEGMIGTKAVSQDDVDKVLRRLVDPAVAAYNVAPNGTRDEGNILTDRIQGLDEGTTTRNAFDPTTDPELRALAMGFIQTGNPAHWERLGQLIQMDEAQRELERRKEILLEAAGDNTTHQAWIGGQMAPPEELGVEVITDAASFGLAKVSSAALKVAGKTARGAKITGRLQKGMDELGKLMLFEDTLANPAGKMRKGWNVAATAGKPALAAAPGEAIEEGLVALGEPGQDAEGLATAMREGFFIGGAAGPVMAWGMVGASKLIGTPLAARADGKFAAWYNQTFKDVEGFKAITRHDAAAARAFMSPVKLKAHRNQLESLGMKRAEILGNLREVTGGREALSTKERVEMSTLAESKERTAEQEKRFEELKFRNTEPTVEELNGVQGSFDDLMAIEAEMGKVRDSMAGDITAAVNAMESVRGATPEARAFRSGMAKAAAGNFDQLTEAERGAVAGATTAEGEAYFEETEEGPVLTAPGRADLFKTAPEVAAIAQNAESQAIFDQKKAEAPIPEQPAPEEAPAPEDGGGTVPESPASDQPATTEQPASGQPTTGTPPSSPAPQSQPGATVPRGTTLEVPEGPAETAPERVAETVRARVAAATGRPVESIRITEEGGSGGGAFADENGVALSLPEIEGAFAQTKGDLEATADYLTNITLRHEIVHEAQFAVIRDKWEAAGSPGTFNEFFASFYGDILGELSPEAIEAARQIYGKESWDSLNDGQKGGELVRMLIEAKAGDERFSELYRAVKRDRPAKLIALLRDMIGKLREMLASGALPEAAAEHLAAVEAVYQELSGQKPSESPESGPPPSEGEGKQETPAATDAPAETPEARPRTRAMGPDPEGSKTPPPSSAPAPSNEGAVEPPAPENLPPTDGLTVEEYPNGTATIEFEGTVLWKGKAEDAAANLEDLRAKQNSTSKVVGDAIAAATEAYPKLGGEGMTRHDKWKWIAEEIHESIEALPPEERRAAADKAIADRIDRVADEEAERTGKTRFEVIEGYRAIAGKNAAKRRAAVEVKVVSDQAPELPEGPTVQRDTPNSEMTVETVEGTVELRQLVGSGDARFPGGALQPRDRSTQKSRNQREEMVRNLRDKEDQWRRYTEGSTTDSGRMVVAPLFNEDGNHARNDEGEPLFYVVSGNGRRNALEEAETRKVAGKVKDGFRENLPGSDGMSFPVPVSIFTPSTAQEAIDLAEYSNRDAQLSVSNTERAQRDAASIEAADLMPLWDTGQSGDPAASSNRDFVMGFAKAVGDEGIIDNSGDLTEEGALRIERAMLASLLGDGAGPVLDRLFNQSGNLGLRGLIGGVASEAGSLLKLAQAKPDFDLSPVLADALRLAVEAKQAVASGEATTVADYFDQGSLFDKTENTIDRQLARALVTARSRKQVRDMLASYRRGADAVDTSTASMFGDETTREELIGKALEVRPIGAMVPEIRAEFGQGSTLASKIEAIDAGVKKLPEDQRRDFAAAVAAEVQRLREDGSLPTEEWQRLNPGALSAREALYQRFLYSHTPETIQGGMNRLLSKPTQEAILAASEETERESLGIKREDMPQIPINRRGRFARWLVSEGVGTSIQELSPDTLTPSQVDLWDTALVGSRKHTRTRMIVTSADGYILDGHHQWKVAQERGKKVPVVVINLPAREALSKMKDFEQVDYDSLPGTEYENEEYQYGGTAPEDWRQSNHPEANIVNPINPDLSPDEKTEAMLELALENIPLVEEILGNLKSKHGLDGKHSIKLPERIQGKASRPSIRAKTPWHDIEHVRDGLRFKVTLTDFRQIEGIAQELAEQGVEIVKLDTKKMFGPKPWGWRFIGFDMRMPNGQLVEFYAPLDTMDAKATKGPNHLLFEKWRNRSGAEIDADPALKAEYEADVKESRERYDAAFMEGINRMGMTYAEAEAAFNKAVLVAESLISSQSDIGPSRTPTVQTEGSVSAQADSPTRKIKARPSGRRANLDPSSEAYARALREGFEVEDTLDKDGEVTTDTRKEGDKGQDNSTLHASAETLDMFGEIEPSILGPRAEAGRRAVKAAKSKPKGSKGRKNVLKQLAKSEGLEDLDLFANAAANALESEPKQLQGDSNERDLFSDSDPSSGQRPARADSSGGQRSTGNLFGLDSPGGEQDGRGSDGDSASGVQPEVRPEGGDTRGSDAGSSDGGQGGQREGQGDGGQDRGEVRGQADGKRRLIERERPDYGSPGRNFEIGPDTTLAEGGAKTRIKNNVAALELLRKLEDDGRDATAAEKESLAKYVGWGGLPQLFDEMARDRVKNIEGNRELVRRWERLGYIEESTIEAKREEIAKAERWEKQWADQYDRLKELLTPDEWQSAQESIINAHYTSPEVIRGMWDAVKRIGVKGGNILEPAGGVGHFFGAMPQDIVGRSQLFGVEMDSISGRIFGKLYPEAEIEVSGFQDSTLPDNSMDLVISNVPFANFDQSDTYLDATPEAPNFRLHNYFFEKALRSARPGGIVAFITSAHTMDSNIAQRKWIAGRSDFLGAVRLPNNAFKGNANTEVVTDIIFLRKPDGSANPVQESWTSTETVPASGGEVTINEYFVRNPDMVLGELSSEGTMHGGEEMTVKASPGASLPVQLSEAVSNLPENVSGDSERIEIDRLGRRNTSAKPGSFVVDNHGNVSVFGGSSQKIAKKNQAKVKAFMSLRDTLNELYAMEANPDSKDTDIEAQRKKLNSDYQRFKSLYKELHNPATMNVLRVDPDFYRVLGLELEGTKAGTYEKADVFSKRVMRPKVEPTKADSLNDAITYSLRWRGRLDTGYIARLLGKSLEEIEADLLMSPSAFRDPVSGMIEQREAYLSGNVRKKLRDARLASENDSDYRRNVEALESVMPEDVPWSDIDVKMGSTWVPPEIYANFLNDSVWGIRNSTEIVYHEGHGEFIPDSFKVVQNRRPTNAVEATWGTDRKSPKDIAEALLNMRSIRVMDSVSDGNGKTKQVFNPAATEKSRQAGQKMKQAFLQWLSETPEAQEILFRAYNEKFNSYVVPEYDGSHMELPWVADDFDLYPEKKHVVWRAIQQGNMLVAHGVGGGKTIIGTAVALEAKRLGMANKPLIVVHNSTLEQFAGTISQMAPTSKVLVARKDDLKGPKRKEFMGRIAAGDWDAVVMAHSTFELIPDDPAWENKQLTDLVQELNDAIRDMGEDPTEENVRKVKDPTAKELVKMKKRLRDRMGKLQERTTDNVLNFQELGIDAMVIDESHLYKKLPFVTKQQNIAGIDTGFSKRAAAVQLRANWIRETNKGRGVFSMTGTPVTNTLGESWNAIRLVRPDLLEDFNVKTFDRFVSTFADIEESGELRPNGQYKAVTRLSKMANIPEWNRMWLTAADVKMGDDMSVKGRPEIKGGGPELVATEKTDQVGIFVEEVKKVIEAFDNMTGKDKRENSHIPMLTYNFSRAAAVDIRLINPDAADEAGSKVNVALDKVAELYRRTDAEKGTQVIFSDIIRSIESNSLDMSQADFEMAEDGDEDSEGNGRFNLYEDIKRKLHEKHGIPLDEIALATDAKNDKQRAAMFAKVNSGKVRIIIGGTSKLGTGVNMQARMIAAHHLDVPWTPAELEQRDGRVYRQGNMWGERGVPVEIYRYGMKDTLDAALWQKLETKERFIKQAVSGKQNARVIEDDAGLISLQEQKAILSGPEGLAKFNLDEQVRQLTNEWRGAQNRRFDLNRAISTAEREAEWAQGQIEPAKARAESMKPLAYADPAEVSWNFGGDTLKGEKARKALDEILKDRRKIAGESLRPQDSERVTEPIDFTANGVSLRLVFDDATENLAGANKPETRWNLKWKIERMEADDWLDVNQRHQVHPASILSETLALADKSAASPEGMQQTIDRSAREVSNLREELAAPFGRQDELEQALIDQAGIYSKMGLDRPLDQTLYTNALGENWDSRLSEVETGPDVAEETREAPRPTPGVGLAPEAQQDVTLYASEGQGTSTDQAAVDQALGSMPPIYRDVFEAINGGATADEVMRRFGISNAAVTNILNAVRSRIEVATKAASPEGLKPAMKDGKLDGGRPDLALSTNPQVAAVDQAREESGVPGVRTFEEATMQAKAMLTKDYAGTYEMILEKGRNHDQLSDVEVAAAKMIISRETINGADASPDQRVKLGMLIHSYRDIGTETARALAIRRDPHKSPAERHAQFIAEALYTPDERTRRAMKNSKDPADREAMLRGWLERVESIKDDLKAQGIDIDASLAKFRRENDARKQIQEATPRLGKIIEEQFKKLTQREKIVIQAIRDGVLVTAAAFQTGMTTEEVKGIYTRFIGGSFEAMQGAAKRYVEASLSASDEAMVEIMRGLGFKPLEEIDDTAPDFDPRRRPRRPGKRTPRKPRKRNTEGPARPAGKPDMTHEEWVNSPQNTTKTVWQGEWKGIDKETGEEVYGTFDMTDPKAMKAVIDAFAIARGSKMDAMLEYWRASILTGPQTAIVNTGSNVLNAAFNLTVKRGTEAAINSILKPIGLGSEDAATFGEFSLMFQQIHKALQLGARNAISSWHLESRVFENYASAKALQFDFTGLGSEYIPPALGGKIGKLMRSLSFRHMTAADEFIKSSYAQMDVAGQAYRMAKAEGLKGEAFSRRIEELMEPGSVAWIRAIDGAKETTFQTELRSPKDGRPFRSIEGFDILAHYVKELRKAPMVGPLATVVVPFIDTPTQILKQGIELTPIGGVLAIVDASRSLIRRVHSGKVSKEVAKKEAEEIYNRLRLVKDLTNQTIAWAVLLATKGLLEPDDEDGRPMLTGTVPYQRTKRGERDNTYAVMPPQSIRIGDTVFSYRRVEPFATVLASLADLHLAARRNGGYVKGAVLSEWMSTYNEQVNDKSFLQGLASAQESIKDPSRFGEIVVSNIATGFVPNIIRQPIRESDKRIRSKHPEADDGFFTAIAKRVGYSVVPQLAPMKLDVWGEPVKASRGSQLFGSEAASAFFRTLDPSNMDFGTGPDPIDLWIFRYNQATADSKERISILPIDNRITFTRDGERNTVTITREEQMEANRKAGQAARAILGTWDGMGSLDERKAERIKEVVSDMQSAQRARLRGKILAEGPDAR